jgi:hypothetical protein
MNKLKPILFLITVLALFTQCNVSKNNPTANSEIDTTKTAVTQNKVETQQVTIKAINTVIVTNSETSGLKNSVTENVNNGNDTIDTFTDNTEITDPEMIEQAKKIYEMAMSEIFEMSVTSPLPKIFSDLFPDVTWKLLGRDAGGYTEKFYNAFYNNKNYYYTQINDFVSIFYKQSEITDEQLIELFIYWYFLTEDENMKIISTTYYVDNIKDFYNYESIIIVNNEEIIVYSNVKNSNFYFFTSYKNEKKYKSQRITY